MSKVETPVSGGDEHKGAPDGESGSPSPRGDANVQGRTRGGESGGGAYPNPHTGKKPTGGGFMGHGGQTEMEYYGGGQAGEGGDAPNAAAGSDSSDGQERGAAPPAQPDREPRQASGGGQSFSVTETDGVAQAEATGNIGKETSEDPDKSAGSG